MPNVVDDITIENAVPLSEEQKAQNAAYFESLGLQAEVVDDGKAATPPVETAPPAPTETDKGTPPAGEKPPAVETAPPAGEVTEEPVDDETQAEWQTATTDGKKLGRFAKKTKIIREQAATLAAKDLELAELKGRLAATTAAPAPGSTLAPPAVAQSAATVPAKEEPKQPEPLKAKEFEKPRPTRPKYSDFVEAEDQAAAHAEALAQYTDDLQTWADDKREFTEQQRVLVADDQRKRDQAQSQQSERKQRIDRKFEEIRTQYPDFEAKTKPMVFPPVLNHVLVEIVSDGLNLGYHLSDPEHAATFKALTGMTANVDVNDIAKVNEAIGNVREELAIFRHQLKSRAAGQPPEEKKPAPTSAAPPTPETTPSSPPPRKEEAAPIPVKGRGAGTPPRPEDIPRMPGNIIDVDAHLELARNGRR